MGRKGKYRRIPFWRDVLVAYVIDFSWLTVLVLITSAISVGYTPWFFLMIWFMNIFILASSEGKRDKRLEPWATIRGWGKGYSTGKSIVGLRMTPLPNAVQLFFVYLLESLPFGIIGILHVMGVFGPFISYLLSILITSSYFALTEGRTGQSLGKKLLGVRVYQLK